MRCACGGISPEVLWPVWAISQRNAYVLKKVERLDQSAYALQKPMNRNRLRHSSRGLSAHHWYRGPCGTHMPHFLHIFLTGPQNRLLKHERKSAPDAVEAHESVTASHHLYFLPTSRYILTISLTFPLRLKLPNNSPFSTFGDTECPATELATLLCKETPSFLHESNTYAAQNPHYSCAHTFTSIFLSACFTLTIALSATLPSYLVLAALHCSFICNVTTK